MAPNRNVFHSSARRRLAAVLLAASALLAGCGGGPPATDLPPFSPLTGPGRGGEQVRQLPPSVRLVGVGDTMMGTNFPDDERLNPDLVPGADLAAIIGEDLLELLRGADATFGNMEGSLFDGESEHKPCRNPERCYVFRSPEFHGGFLREMGFDAMSLANNHSGDFREMGRAATMATLARNGIAFAGIDEPGARTATVLLESGVRVGFVAFAPNWGTLDLNDHGRAQQIVGELDAGHDIVVVSFHGGAEGAEMTRVPREMEIFVGEQRGDVYGFAHAVIDAGADVVLGHGPHVPRAVEVYRGRFIAYSLGNFWTYGRFNLQDLAGIAPVVDLEISPGDGRLITARIHSIRQEGWGVPLIDPSGAALGAVAEFTDRDFPESVLQFEDDGRITGFSGPPLIGWLGM